MERFTGQAASDFLKDFSVPASRERNSLVPAEWAIAAKPA